MIAATALCGPLMFHISLAGGGGVSGIHRHQHVGDSRQTNQALPRAGAADGGARPSKTTANGSIATAELFPKVAYVVTITKCGTSAQSDSHWKQEYTLVDAAAVFQHAVRLVSKPLHPTSQYRSKLYAIVYVEAKDSRCVSLLRNLGYEVLICDIPVPNPLSHILREFPVMNKKFPGAYPPHPWINDIPCCGPAEFIKLRIYELVQHPVVVLLDLDSILLRPLDELFDAMLLSPDDPRGKAARRHLVDASLLAPTYAKGASLPQDIPAFFTKDWCGAKPDTARWVGVQGGFLVARPDLNAYQQLKDILREGNYILGRGEGSGWGGTGYGNHIYGSMTFQGLMAYYQEVVARTPGVELHRCKFNQMADNPRLTLNAKFPRPTPLDPKLAGYSDGACRDGRNDCDDVQCQTWPVEDSRSLHFTHCLKPWICPTPPPNTTVEATCRKMHREWFRIRKELELERKYHTPNTGEFMMDSFLGYCKSTGHEGYINMNFGRNA